MAPAECRVGRNDPGRQGRCDRPSRGRRGLRTWTSFLGRCDPVGWLGGRESIFKILHTGEFRGNWEVATQTVRSHLPQTRGRRVYEEGAMESNGKERAVRLVGRPCLLLPLYRCGQGRTGPTPPGRRPPVGGSCLKTFCGRAALASGLGTFPR